MSPMWAECLNFFFSVFENLSFWGIAVALVWGAFWLAPYMSPLFRDYRTWMISACSAILTVAAVSFIQIPLQTLAGSAVIAMLVSGLVQEAAKLVPVLVFKDIWFKNIDARQMVAVGAVSGAGFGILESMWIHNKIFASGWNVNMIHTEGIMVALGFFERFTSVGFHTAATAVVGYGIARKKCWSLYLLVSLIHGADNYIPAFSLLEVELYLALSPLLLTFLALYLRWRAPRRSFG